MRSGSGERTLLQKEKQLLPNSVLGEGNPPSERTRRERSLRWSPGCAVPQRESGLGERASQPAAHGQSGQPLAS